MPKLKTVFATVGAAVHLFCGVSFADEREKVLKDLREEVNTAERKGQNVTEVKAALGRLEEVQKKPNAAGVPPELGKLYDAVSQAQKKGEDVSQITKKVESLYKEFPGAVLPSHLDCGEVRARVAEIQRDLMGSTVSSPSLQATILEHVNKWKKEKPPVDRSEEAEKKRFESLFHVLQRDGILPPDLKFSMALFGWSSSALSSENPVALTLVVEPMTYVFVFGDSGKKITYITASGSNLPISSRSPQGAPEIREILTDWIQKTKSKPSEQLKHQELYNSLAPKGYFHKSKNFAPSNFRQSTSADVVHLDDGQNTAILGDNKLSIQEGNYFDGAEDAYAITYDYKFSGKEPLKLRSATTTFHNRKLKDYDEKAYKRFKDELAKARAEYRELCEPKPAPNAPAHGPKETAPDAGSPDGKDGVHD